MTMLVVWLGVDVFARFFSLDFFKQNDFNFFLNQLQALLIQKQLFIPENNCGLSFEYLHFPKDC